MEDVTKLPKWAQNMVRDLSLERDALKRLLDTENKSPFYSSEELGRCYFHPAHNSMKIQAHGILLDVTVSRDALRLYFDSREIGKEVFLEPRARNSIYLRCLEDKDMPQ